MTAAAAVKIAAAKREEISPRTVPALHLDTRLLERGTGARADPALYPSPSPDARSIIVAHLFATRPFDARLCRPRHRRNLSARFIPPRFSSRSSSRRARRDRSTATVFAAAAAAAVVAVTLVVARHLGANTRAEDALGPAAAMRAVAVVGGDTMSGCKSRLPPPLHPTRRSSAVQTRRFRRIGRCTYRRWPLPKAAESAIASRIPATSSGRAAPSLRPCQSRRATSSRGRATESGRECRRAADTTARGCSPRRDRARNCAGRDVDSLAPAHRPARREFDHVPSSSGYKFMCESDTRSRCDAQ